MNVAAQTTATSTTTRRFSARDLFLAAIAGTAIAAAAIIGTAVQPSSTGSEPLDRVSAAELLVDRTMVEFRRGEQGSAGVGQAGGSLVDPGLVEFRRGEHASGIAGEAPAEGLLDPGLVEFRRGEHSSGTK